MRLNEIQMRYLLAILHRHMEDDIRSVDIAKDMHEQQPTAFKRLESLKHAGLIVKRRYRNIQLTEQGMCIAQHLQDQHSALYYFFRCVLGTAHQEARESAFVFMGALSDQSLEKLEAYIANLDGAKAPSAVSDPHKLPAVGAGRVEQK